ncbi:MAG: hydrolase, partial [Planctomycetota bacterium]
MSRTWLARYEPPLYQPHRYLRGGHLQTIIKPRTGLKLDAKDLISQQWFIPVSGGDRLVVHDDRPRTWASGDGGVLCLHGICG